MADLLAHQDSVPLPDHHDSERLAPVLFAGIAWTDRGFHVSLLDERGITAAPLAHFPAGQVPALIDHLRGTGHSPEQRVNCVVESTNGMIDGGMITAGLCVYRADPWVLPDLKWPEIAVQLERTDEILAGAAGLHGPRLFRPPYGSRTPKILARLADEPGGHTVVLWDVEPFDWQLPGAGAIARSVLTQVKPGSIVVIHDGGGDRSQTVEALSPIIEGLLARDYRFVRVDELIR